MVNSEAKETAKQLLLKGVRQSGFLSEEDKKLLKVCKKLLGGELPEFDVLELAAAVAAADDDDSG